MNKPRTARTFATSLKPALTNDKIDYIVNSLVGTAKVYAITHDKDEGVEPHTHFVLDYKTPRQISTVANIFEVESNFIEVVRNKKGMLRYLIHLDDKDKYQYKPEQVISNDKVKFSDVLLGDTLSDREIAEFIIKGKGLELIGLVPAGKLRTIQSFLHFDNSNRTYQELKALNLKMDEINDTIQSVKLIADSFVSSINFTEQELLNGFRLISDSIDAVVQSKVLK